MSAEIEFVFHTYKMDGKLIKYGVIGGGVSLVCSLISWRIQEKFIYGSTTQDMTMVCACYGVRKLCKFIGALSMVGTMTGFGMRYMHKRGTIIKK